MHISLKRQVALVTGGSSGIGAAIAAALAKAGAAVAINYHHHAEPAEELASKIRGEGGDAIAVGADVGDESQVHAMFDTVLGAFGRLDILVANSGLQRDAPIDDMSLQDWNLVINTNLTGQFLCAKAAIRQFGKQDVRPEVSRARGKIIHISSVHQRVPWAGRVNYAASKGGVDLMMQSLAQEVSERGIRINSLAPGAIVTPINEENVTGEAEKEVLKLIPYGRVGQVEDVASVAVFLASDLADYMVGTTLFIDGGMSLYPEFKGNG